MTIILISCDNDRASTDTSLKTNFTDDSSFIKKYGHITIEVHDNQYTCYNSMEYHLTDSSLTIDNYSEHADIYDSLYEPEILFEKILSKAETNKLNTFMQRFPFDTLKPEYSSGIDKECEEQRLINIQISFGTKNKNIQIVDCYQTNVAELFGLINLFLPKSKYEELKIEYLPTTFDVNVDK